ncbi:MAG TPA: glutamate synthase central domain-containing protein, partial [Prosthecobacter sp.]
MVRNGLQILENLDHRGACVEENTGDGAGILMQTPHKFLSKVAKEAKIDLPAQGSYGVANLFVSQDGKIREQVKGIFEKIASDEGCPVIGWRAMPTFNGTLGKSAKVSEPFMLQVFLKRGDALKDEISFERKLYVIRKLAHTAIRATQIDNRWYAPSLSCRTLVYKGMLTPIQVGEYFLDLQDPDMESALALVHSRFSTNTFPSWERSHPYRYIAHNGEINTLRGNINWMHARQSLFASELFGDDIQKIKPVINIDGSDSTIFDNALELLVLSGRSLPHAMMMMIPEPWSGHESMSEAKKAFYEYHSCLMEPWDGPASVAFTDGTMMGATLDRNGLRPSRYYVTKDDFVIMGSEAGVLPVAPENVKLKGRLQPGKMFIVNMEEGRIVPDDEIKEKIAAEKPYREWLDKNLVKLADIKDGEPAPLPDHDTMLKRQQAFGYTWEDLRMLMVPMARDGVEAIGSMGTDIPIAVLSSKAKLLYDYFKQLFAQVTNPPIDCIREEIITSPVTTIGREGNLLDPKPESCHLIELKTPILSNEELAKLKCIADGQFASATLEIFFDPKNGAAGLEKAMDDLCAKADELVAKGRNILILTDRGVSQDKAAIPALLAVGGLHHHLIRKGTRTQCDIVLESGEPREVHHFCTLIGYGCGAINPYLAFETLDDMIRQGLLVNVDHKKAVVNFIKAATKGVIKVASKIGISTMQSYRGAQIFEAVGLSRSVVEKYFTSTATRVEGSDIKIIAEEAIQRHLRGFPDRDSQVHALDVGGDYQWRKEGEAHLFNPLTIHTLQKAVRTGNYETFKQYTALVNTQVKQFYTLRGLLDFKAQTPVPIEEVESIESILKRFKTGAM